MAKKNRIKRGNENDKPQWEKKSQTLPTPYKPEKPKTKESKTKHSN